MTLYLKVFALGELERMVIDCQGYIALTTRRRDALKRTQAVNPGWQSYDKHSEAVVGIDVRIEEQQAILESQECDLIDIEKEISKRRKDNLRRALGETEAKKAKEPTTQGRLI